MLIPGFSEVSALLAVLENKSFTKAAKQLGLSLARVSELVRILEERVGVRLVERTTRSVPLPRQGSVFWSGCGPCLTSINRLSNR